MIPNGNQPMNIIPTSVFAMNAMDKNNQLLAGTQSMLNGISAIPQLNQLSVSNMSAITPIAKVKSFQFSSPTNASSQISPQYLPTLATTPRFTVPTPRNNGYHITGNINQLNNAMTNASNNGTFQIPTSLLKNTNVAQSTASIQKEEDQSTTNGKIALNAQAVPFSLNATTASIMLSPRTSSIASPKHAQFVPPPHPQSFAFPPPPIPQTANWLPVQINHSQIQQQQQLTNGNHNMNVNAQSSGNHQSPINVPLVQRRGSPLFAPTQSPQFQPFSH